MIVQLFPFCFSVVINHVCQILLNFEFYDIHVLCLSLSIYLFWVCLNTTTTHAVFRKRSS
ncbi:hypothetical protein MtrunA17_Chr1g0176201 [Medicago truncatula]|uniref:Transmembrane protein n=1 Tax=Medicago truncatula TaxID=3880 RepID=A0A396JQ69_MEDTR|nr:hypothetical protein MtrunA17_Chr1g0176201 [Medicago truncatula]